MITAATYSSADSGSGSGELGTQCSATPAQASVASWLAVLFLMLFALNTIGGWVRLSGAGVAIPQWPIINGSLLPPMTNEGWIEVKASYDADQARLASKIVAGGLTHSNLGRQPRDLAEFRGMFLTEWSHRLFAALVGVMAAGCLTVVWRRPDLRRLVGGPMAAMGILVITQAVLGGVLVSSGTNTHWLFLHQGNAGMIMACVLVAMLRLVAVGRPLPSASTLGHRQVLIWVLGVAMVSCWLQLVIGALVAGSRNDEGFSHWPLASGPLLWEAPLGLVWNLLDNTQLHQWAHGGWAYVLTGLLIISYVLGWRLTRITSYVLGGRHTRVGECGPRLRLALQVSATFLVIQLMLGIANALLGITAQLALAHQVMGMCLFLSLVLAWFDARHEPAETASIPTVPPVMSGTT